MNDPDARIWTVSGYEMTLYPRGSIIEGKQNAKQLRVITDWMEKNLQGEFTVTPIYVGFEIKSDAMLFKLGYVYD